MNTTNRDGWERKDVTRGGTAAWEQADMLAQQCVVGWDKAHPYAIEAQALADRIKADNDAWQPTPPPTLVDLMSQTYTVELVEKLTDPKND